MARSYYHTILCSQVIFIIVHDAYYSIRELLRAYVTRIRLWVVYVIPVD